MVFYDRRKEGFVVMKKILILVSVLMLLVAGSVLLPVHGEQEIYSTVVRLHVLANSDSSEDQALKLKVRDAVLEVTSPLMRGCTDREEAERILAGAEEEILAAARRVIAEEGREDPVSLTFCEEVYPEKSYGEFTFPSGTYLSMRVLIGEGSGQNWWCVLFPPLCLSAATADKAQTEDAFVSVGLNKEQYGVITETENTTYRVRFRILEMFSGWFQ